MRVSLLVPVYNEEKGLEASILAALRQTRPFDELIFVDDCSKDGTQAILAKYSRQVTARRTPKNTGNKSSAQEYGLQFVTGDVMVTTDGDTLLDPKFCEEVVRSFKEQDVFAVAGYVKSLPYNWLTLCRAFEYAVGQNVHKIAQNYMQYIFVMPGAASAFKVDTFRKYITFDHDTITEDLDFTYKMHKNHFKIVYNKKAICYTQDPANMNSYINQMRRWFGGGWQNLIKHYTIVRTKPIRAFELSLLYAEGVIFSILLLVLPFLNVVLGLYLLAGYLAIAFLFAVWAAFAEKRWMLIMAPVPYVLIMFVNSYIYLEQFVAEVILKRKNLIWFKPDRVSIKVT